MSWQNLKIVSPGAKEEETKDWKNLKKVPSLKPEFRDIVSEELRSKGYEPETEEEFERLAEKGTAEAYKGLFSGATLGASKYIPGLKSGENFAEKAGEYAGIAAPFSAASKAVDAGTKIGQNVIKNLPKALKLTGKFSESLQKSALTGAVIKGGERVISGENPFGKETGEAALEFATLHLILMGAGAAGQALWNQVKNLPWVQAKKVQQALLGGEKVPKSVQDQAEGLLKELQGFETQSQASEKLAQEALESQVSQKEKFLPSKISELKGEEARPLEGRVKPIEEKLNLEIPKGTQKTSPENEIGSIFSKEKFKNTTEGGKAQKSEIIKEDQAKYKKVNEKYKKSREANSLVSEEQPELVEYLDDVIYDLEQIPSPSGPQKELISSAKSIRNRLLLFDDAGNVIGLNPINNQILIDQVQSLRQKIDYDFAHGDARNIFKPLIGKIQGAVETSAQEAGNEAAILANQEARKEYKEWADLFDNEYIRPIRDKQNRDYSKLYKGSLDVDEFNEMSNVLKNTEEGRKILDVMKRDLVNKHLEKFYDKPIQSSLEGFNKQLSELEAVISPEEANQARQKFIELKQRKPLGFKGKEVNPLEKAKNRAAQQLSKYQKMKPEQVYEMMSTRSGIRELEKDIEKTPEAKKFFEVLKKQKIRDILQSNNLEKDLTGTQLYEALNKRENFELLSELIGEEEVEAARKASKDIGKKQVKYELGKKVIQKTAFAKFLHTVWPLVLTI